MFYIKQVVSNQNYFTIFHILVVTMMPDYSHVVVSS
jgi:hypothetical protein